MPEIVLNRTQYLEFEKIALGAFAPLSGFMDETTFHSVVDSLRLPNGSVFPLPVILDVSERVAAGLKGAKLASLIFEDVEVGTLALEGIFSCDKAEVLGKVYGTNDPNHPGVQHFLSMGDVFVGGAVTLIKRAVLDISSDEMTPEETKAAFAERGWSKIVGFQTRNVPHRAHEYLQRIALEHCDGLFIQPVVGRKKAGDFAPAAIMAGYRTLVSEFLRSERVILGILSTSMRYAGPREALFHAIVRRNYGCTHFIVGRDHAGVGDYYGKYEAHELCRQFEGELGIQVMCLHGPYHCAKCGGIVTEHICPHLETAPDQTTEISGTDVRAMLVGGSDPDPEIMRPAVVESVRGTQMFIEVTDP